MSEREIIANLAVKIYLDEPHARSCEIPIRMRSAISLATMIWIQIPDNLDELKKKAQIGIENLDLELKKSQVRA